MVLRGLALAGAAVLCLVTAASAATDSAKSPATNKDGWYAGLGAGATLPGDFDGTAMQPSWRVSGSVGYIFDQNWRAEMEIAYAGPRAKYWDRGVSQINVFLNGFYDIPITDRFYATAGAGFGSSNVTASGLGYTGRSVSFAGQLIAGVGYALTDKTDIQFDYRYQNSLLRINSGNVSWQANNFMLSTRFHF